jgi:hypothetical protein
VLAGGDVGGFVLLGGGEVGAAVVLLGGGAVGAAVVLDAAVLLVGVCDEALTVAGALALGESPKLPHSTNPSTPTLNRSNRPSRTTGSVGRSNARS